MLLRRSSLAARTTERPFLAPTWLIALLAAIVGLALFFLYPRLTLERSLATAQEGALSAAYLANLLRSDPDNPKLRLLLAHQQLKTGRTTAARKTLQPALDASDPALRREALWLLWQLTEFDYFDALAKHKAGPPEIRDELRRQLHQLVKQPWPPERQIELATRAIQLGEHTLGTGIFRQLGESMPDQKQAAELLERAARSALAGGDYAACAELYLQARKLGQNPADDRRLFHAALRALQSGNQPLAAVELGEREIGSLANDPETLYLMTNLARAAGRPDLADRYVRRLLQLSLNRQWQALQFARAWGEGVFRKVNTLGEASGPGIAFDDKAYTLGYEVFLENRKLEDAWRVAASAVRQAPDDMLWRERLARVAEWTGRPQEALASWLKIGQRTQKDEAWQGVLRLSPGLFDDAALLQALRYQLASQPNNLVLTRELVATYERLGEPQPAIDYLQRQTKNRPRPELLELLAKLAERAGQNETALAAWTRLLAEPEQLNSERAQHIAILLLIMDRGAEGLDYLKRAQARVALNSPSDIEFWRLNGQLAEMQQNDEQAINAFQRLIDADKAELGDYDALIRLLNTTRPLQAARLAGLAWDRFDEPRHLLQALNLYAAENHWTEIGRLLKELDPAPDAARHALHRLQSQPDFLRLVGTYQQHTGQLRLARQNFETALRLSPASADLQQALIWLLIDSNNAAALRKLLASNEMAWRQNSALHDSLASAYQALSLPQVALQRYLTPRIAAHQDDFLWLMNYADALDQNQQSDRAWRLRRHLLSNEWQSARGNRSLTEAHRNWLTEEGLDQTRRLARTRLLLTQRPGDVGTAALRELLRLDRDAKGNYSDAAAETAIGWLQDHAEYTAERGFLWQQYARARSTPANRPLWAEITVALAEDDKASIGQLLSTFDERLPRYDRVNAARAVDDLRRAQTAAFEAQSDQTDDDPTHLQLSETLLTFSDHANLAFGNQNLGAIDEQRLATGYHLAIDPRLSLDFDWGRLKRSVRDNNVALNVPSEKFFAARLNWRHPNGETTFMAAQRDSLAPYTPLQIEHEQRIDNRLSLRLGLGTQLPTQESLPLRVAGMKDRASLSLRYRPTRLDQIVLEHWREQYQLQTGASVGDGAHNAVTVSHTYRQEARDLEFSAFWSNHQYQRREDFSGISVRDQEISRLFPANFTPGIDYFLPDNFSYYGLRVSTDVRYEQEYTRATRPFASLARTWHTALGPGYDLRLGLAGSVLGADHLALSWGLGKAGLQTGGMVRDLQLTYRIHY